MAEEKIWQPLELVKVTAEYLGGKRIPNPRLDAEILLCEILGLVRRIDLYAGFEREISGKELASYRELIKRRAAREPVSRILGHREFMGLGFKVTPDVLSPRPETELLVEAVLEVLKPKPIMPEVGQETKIEAEIDDAGPDGMETMSDAMNRILDSYACDVDDADSLDDEPAAALQRDTVRHQDPRPGNKVSVEKKTRPATAPSREIAALDLGTGSGCIAIALAAHCPGVRVTAIDASPKALAVAKKNAHAAGVAERVTFRQGDWFAACRDGEQFDFILSNPPYLVEGDPEIWPEVSRYDPPIALYGGQDGLDCYRRMIPEAAEWLTAEGWIFFEVGDGQADRVADMLRGRGFRRIEVVLDYAGVKRIVRASAP